jgi:hypothetical protein
VAISFLFQYGLKIPSVFLIAMIPAYACIIAAFIIDSRKVKPHIRAYQSGASAAKSPKQVKHEMEAQAQAQALETARKAAKDSKKAKR